MSLVCYRGSSSSDAQLNALARMDVATASIPIRRWFRYALEHPISRLVALRIIDGGDVVAGASTYWQDAQPVVK
jgi:hypothetical protein